MSEWISVKNRLPQKEIKVLILDNGFNEVAEEAKHWLENDPYRIGYLYEALVGDVWMIECRLSGSNYISRSVTYWMPLPDAPK